jgi:hypothetical protein
MGILKIGIISFALRCFDHQPICMGAESNNPIFSDEEMHNDAAGPWGPSPIL